MRELLLEIGTSVRRNKLRTALTGFSVAWGIFMLTVLLGSGNGLRHGVMANFGDYAVNSINLWGGSTSKPWHGHDKYRRIRLSYDDDLGMLAAEFPEVLDITASVWYPEQTATAGRRRTCGSLRGTLPEIARIEGPQSLRRAVPEPQRRGAAAQVGGHRRVAAPRTLRRPGPHGARTAHRPLGLYDRGRGAERRQPLDGLRLHSAHHRAPALRAGRPRIDNILFTVRDLDTDAAMEAFEERLRTPGQGTTSTPRTATRCGSQQHDAAQGHDAPLRRHRDLHLDHRAGHAARRRGGREQHHARDRRRAHPRIPGSARPWAPHPPRSYGSYLPSRYA